MPIKHDKIQEVSKRILAMLLAILTILQLGITTAKAYSTSDYSGTYGLVIPLEAQSWGDYWYRYGDKNKPLISSNALGKFTVYKESAGKDWYYSDKAYLKPTSNCLLYVGIGKRTGQNSFDPDISGAKNWTITKVKGSGTITLETYPCYANTTGYALRIKNLVKGDIWKVYSSFLGETFYILGGDVADFNGTIIIKSGTKDVTGSTLEMNVGESVTFSYSASGLSNLRWGVSSSSCLTLNGSKVTVNKQFNYSEYVTLSGTNALGETVTKKVYIKIKPNAAPVINSITVENENSNDTTIKQTTKVTVNATDDKKVASYGYSKTTNSSGVSTWQTSNIFNLPSGKYYFFAKDEDGAISAYKYQFISGMRDYDSIAELVPPTKLEYKLGESLNLSGSSITMTYKTVDGITPTSTKLSPIPSKWILPYDTNKEGKQTITVSINNVTGTFDVTFIKGISSEKLVDVKTDYILNDDFVEQGYIHIIYDDSTEEKIPITESMVSGFDTSTTGSKEVTVTYNGKEYKYTITVQNELPITLEVNIPNLAVYSRSKLASIVVSPESNVDFLELPDGRKVYGKAKADFLITNNGNYTFSVFSKDKINKDSEQIVVSTVDNEPPLITIGYNKYLSKVAINALDNIEMDKVILPDGVVIPASNLPVVLDVADITMGTVLAYDSVGNISAKDFSIDSFNQNGGNGETYHTYIGVSGIPDNWTNTNANISIAAYSPNVNIDDINVTPSAALRRVEGLASSLITDNPLMCSLQRDLENLLSEIDAEEDANRQSINTIDTTYDINDPVYSIRDSVSLYDGEAVETNGTGYNKSVVIEVPENGKYNYTVKNVFGTYDKSFVVDKIDKIAPTISVETAENEVIIDTQDNLSGLYSIEYPDGNVDTFGSDKQGVSSSINHRFDFSEFESGTYSVRATDYAGNVTTTSFNLDNDGNIGDQETNTEEYKTVKFMSNVPSISFTPVVLTVKLGESCTVIDHIYKVLPAGVQFENWVDADGNVFNPGDVIENIQEDKTLYVNVSYIDYSIKINANGTGLADIIETVHIGDNYTWPEHQEIEGKEFYRYSTTPTNEQGSKLYHPNEKYIVEGNLEVYMIYKDKEIPKPSPSPSPSPAPSPEPSPSPAPSPSPSPSPAPNPSPSPSPKPDPAPNPKPDHGNGGGSTSDDRVEPERDKANGVDDKGKRYELNNGIKVSSEIDKGYILGKPKYVFGPDDLLTRAEFAVMLNRVFKFNNTSINSSFDDVKSGWCKKSIELLASRKVMIGTGNNKFSPDSPITVEEVLTTLGRIVYLDRYTSTIDGIKVSDTPWSEKAVARAINAGIADLEDGKNAKSNITRKQIVRFINNIVYKDLETSKENIFKDIDESNDYYKDIIKSIME